MKGITLEEIIYGMDLEIIYKAKETEEIKLHSPEVNRPGLQLVGYFEKFNPSRLQVIGNAEWHYCNELPESLRYDSFEKLLSYPIPALIFSRNLPIFPEVLEYAKKYNRTILRVDRPTTKLINGLVDFIEIKLAPETTMHGVLLEVHGIGVLLTGQSGVGKSETALDLVFRGHRLISDDRVTIKRVEDYLRGESPKLTRYFMEIRGIGILDIERLYGIGAVKEYEYIDIVMDLEKWDDTKEYDRVGLDEGKIDILGIKLPKVIIPVKPGRNIAMIIEVAARNNRQKRLGYNAAESLNDRIMKEIESRRKSNE